MTQINESTRIDKFTTETHGTTWEGAIRAVRAPALTERRLFVDDNIHKEQRLERALAYLECCDRVTALQIGA